MSLSPRCASTCALDEWVMPSHIQIARVLDGGLDAAIAWAPAAHERLHLQLLSVEPLAAIVPARVTHKMIPAGRLRALVDADLTSWDAWNQFGRSSRRQPARGSWRSTTAESPAADSTITAEAERAGAAIAQTPPGSVPPGLRTRSVRDPAPLWCWSLVTRADDDRAAVLALRDTAQERPTRPPSELRNRATSVPGQDPHRDTISKLTGRLRLVGVDEERDGLVVEIDGWVGHDAPPWTISRSSR